MKMTKMGSLPSDRVWRGRCRSCGAEFEASERELSNIQHDQRDGSSAWAMCDFCGAGSKGYGGVCFYPVKEVHGGQ